MTTPLTLHGYHHSVYTWIVRMMLCHLNITYRTTEVNPFENTDSNAQSLHPFGRVPVLVHGTFTLFETAAITRYIDRTFGAGALCPDTAQAQARMDQVIGIVDNYGYIPMVRQVFAHAVFRPWAHEATDHDQITRGLADAQPVLAALDAIASEGLVLTPDGTLTLADCHLAPMLSYFTQATAGQDAVEKHPALARWWHGIKRTPALHTTAPKRDTQSS